MPTPCPHPRPVTTAASRSEETMSQLDGIVTGSEAGGYRPGSRHGAQVFTASRKVPRAMDRDAPPPEISILVPASRTLEIIRPSGHSPAAWRNLARSADGRRTRPPGGG